MKLAIALTLVRSLGDVWILGLVTACSIRFLWTWKNVWKGALRPPMRNKRVIKIYIYPYCKNCSLVVLYTIRLGVDMCALVWTNISREATLTTIMADYRENVWPVAVNYMFKENFDASVIIDAHEILNHNKLLSVQVVKISYTAIKSYKLNKNENKSRKLITSNNFSDLLKPVTVIMPMLELSKFVESITALSLLFIVMSWALTEIMNGEILLSVILEHPNFVAITRDGFTWCKQWTGLINSVVEVFICHCTMYLG